MLSVHHYPPPMPPDGFPPRARTEAHCRWLITRDLPELLQIEQEEYGQHAWTEKRFRTELGQINCIGHVMEIGPEDARRVVGFLVWTLQAQWYEFVSLVVARAHRRQGIASQAVRRIMGRIVPGARRQGIICAIDERYVPTLLFLRSLGFKATKVLRRNGAAGPDFYQMEYRPHFPPAEGACTDARAQSSPR